MNTQDNQRPLISIITVNLNDIKGLKKTLLSIITQNFRNFEHIIIDGGSSDGSREFISANQQKISYWVSETDKGIYNAMNKGILKASGTYLMFLNSGDYLYSQEALTHLVIEAANCDLVYGNMLVEENTGMRRQIYPAELDFLHFYSGHSLPHQATLIKKILFDKIGFYNESFKIVSDWEFFINAVSLHNASYKYVDADIAVFATGGMSALPANTHLYAAERQQTYQKYYQAFLPLLAAKAVVERELRLIKSSRLHRLAAGISKLFAKNKNA